MTDQPPVPTGRVLRAVSLTGKLFPWMGGPVFLATSGLPCLYLPCFTEEAMLRSAMRRSGAPFASIKRIDHGGEFLDRLPRVVDDKLVKVMLDPYWLENGRVRWTEIKWK